MAVDTGTTRNGRNGAFPSPTGGRGHPLTITQRRTTAFAPYLEGIALADEVIAGAERIQTAVATGNRELAVNEAGRLGHRATVTRDELREMVGRLEK